MNIETLAFGYGLIEGPRVDGAGNLYFSDVTNGGVYRRRPGGEIDTVVPKRRGVGGIALHADGGLVIGGKNICHVKDGTTRVLFTRDDAPGFNDLFTDAQGRVYTGTMKSDPFKFEGERVRGECWRIDAEGKGTQLYGGVSLTNGIGFSPDETRIYHADTAQSCVLVHELDSAGNAKPLTPIRVEGSPDGLAFDIAGNIFVATSEGIDVDDPRGTLWVVIPVQMQPANCAYGDTDHRTLYITARNALYRVRLAHPGLPRR